MLNCANNLFRILFFLGINICTYPFSFYKFNLLVYKFKIFLIKLNGYQNTTIIGNSMIVDGALTSQRLIITVSNITIGVSGSINTDALGFTSGSGYAFLFIFNFCIFNF